MPSDWKNVSPSVLENRKGPLTVTVHRHIHYPPDMWLVTCFALGLDKRELQSKELPHAKAEALHMCRMAITSLDVALTKMSHK